MTYLSWPTIYSWSPCSQIYLLLHFCLIENSCEARYILFGMDGARDSESLNCQLKHQEPKQQISLFERISKILICIASLFNEKSFRICWPMLGTQQPTTNQKLHQKLSTMDAWTAEQTKLFSFISWDGVQRCNESLEWLAVKRHFWRFPSSLILKVSNVAAWLFLLQTGELSIAMIDLLISYRLNEKGTPERWLKSWEYKNIPNM